MVLEHSSGPPEIVQRVSYIAHHIIDSATILSEGGLTIASSNVDPAGYGLFAAHSLSRGDVVVEVVFTKFTYDEAWRWLRANFLRTSGLRVGTNGYTIAYKRWKLIDVDRLRHQPRMASWRPPMWYFANNGSPRDANMRMKIFAEDSTTVTVQWIATRSIAVDTELIYDYDA